MNDLENNIDNNLEMEELTICNPNHKDIREDINISQDSYYYYYSGYYYDYYSKNEDSKSESELKPKRKKGDSKIASVDYEKKY